MLPPLRSHEEYIKFIDENLKNVSVPEVHKDVVDKLKKIDLSKFEKRSSISNDLMLSLLETDSGAGNQELGTGRFSIRYEVLVPGP